MWSEGWWVCGLCGVRDGGCVGYVEWGVVGVWVMWSEGWWVCGICGVRGGGVCATD